MPGQTIEDVIARLVRKTNGCWEWPRPGIDGYGTTSIEGRVQAIHIAVYVHRCGPYTAGFELDHMCRNRACANPDHLQPVTPKENGNRAARRRFPDRMFKVRLTYEDTDLLEELARDLALSHTEVVRLALKLLRGM